MCLNKVVSAGLGYFQEWSHTVYIFLGLVPFPFHSALCEIIQGTVIHLHPVDMLQIARRALVQVLPDHCVQ